MGDDILSRPLTLPCGVILPGRIVKAAMTEGLADEWNRATKEHVKLYSEWSKGHNAGHVLITGNIAVDRRFPERPGNVAIDGKQSVEALEALRAYANAGKHDGTLIFAQLSHGGRQSNQMVNLNPVAPSAVSTSLAGMIPLGEPRALSLEEIEDVINRFVFAAEVCKEVGFSGIQIHGAHGYLLSSFLNPLANKRDDIFGGSLDNRSRILFEIVRRTRAKVGRNYPIAVKLNSSDFQKGGFEPEESLEIARRLEAEGVDILEISGGNYENPSMMMGPDGLSKVKSLSQMGKYTSTQVREGYFMVFAEKMRQTVKKMPLMVTGGFRSRVMMESALQSGAADLIGVGRPLCGGYDYVGKLLRREIDQLPKFETSIDLPWFLRFLKYIVVGHFIQSGGFQAWTYCNLVRLGKGEKPTTDEDANLLFDLIRMTTHDSGQATRLKGLPDIRGQFLNAPKSSRFKIGVSIALVFVLVLLARRVLKHSL